MASSKDPSLKAPWKHLKPKSATGRKMTKAQVQQARIRAAKAGRPYPNLVDNMAVLKEAKKTD